jgi:hypothetical protein
MKYMKCSFAALLFVLSLSACNSYTKQICTKDTQVGALDLSGKYIFENPLSLGAKDFVDVTDNNDGSYTAIVMSLKSFSVETKIVTACKIGGVDYVEILEKHEADKERNRSVSQ